MTKKPITSRRGVVIRRGQHVSQLNLAQSAYESLRDAIQGGAISPGQRIREKELSDWLKVSRTPVREALRRLQSEGMIEARGGGLAVVSLDMRAVTELYDLRETLEGTAASLAARHADPTEIALLHAMIEAQRASPHDARALIVHNRNFHEQIYRAAHNRFLLRTLIGLRDAQVLLGTTTLAQPERADHALSEHAEILAAIEARNSAAAEEAARRHIRAGYKERVRAMTAEVREAAQAET